MGFSESKKAIDRVRPVLDLVSATDGNTIIRIPSKTPIKLSYTIFEALRVASKLKNSDHKYSELKEKYKIRTKPDHVVFEPRIGVDLGEAMIELAQARVVEEEMVMNEISGLFDVVGAVIKHKAARMVFPSAAITDTSRLEKWCMNNHYLITSNDPLTLVKNERNSTEESSISQHG